MEQKMFMVAFILFSIFFCLLSFSIGYIKGFKKCKKIDDEIIEKTEK